MGTSRSSSGPRGGVALIPPWVPPGPLAPPEPEIPPPSLPPVPASPRPPRPSAPQDEEPEDAPQPLAPPRRFQSARSNLGKFAQSGSESSLRRSLGHYTKSGYGGSAQAAARMGGTARTAGRLYGVLDDLAKQQATLNISLSPADLVGLSQQEVADRIIDALAPLDGTQDTDAARDAMARAFSELLASEPAADLLKMTEPQIDMLTMLYVGNDLTNRIELDIGTTIIAKAPTFADGYRRLEQVKAFVRQEIARRFRARSDIGDRLTRASATRVTNSVLRDTFDVFEAYL